MMLDGHYIKFLWSPIPDIENKLPNILMKIIHINVVKSMLQEPDTSKTK